MVWSEAGETFTITGRDMKHAGFSLVFALHNNTPRDITIPTDATIMKRLKKGKTLTEYSGVKLNQSVFSHRIKARSCPSGLIPDATTKIWQPAP